MVLLPACGPSKGGLNRVEAAGVLRVAIDPSFPPFESVNTEGQIIGLDAELATAIANELGVEVQLVTTGYDALYDALTVGRADVIISALYPDPSRSAGFVFSTPYFNAGQVLIVPENSEISSVPDLAGKSVACVFGTSGHMEALDWKENLAPLVTIVTVDDPPAVLDPLSTGKAQAAVVDHVSAQILLAQQPGMRILSPPVTDEPYVIAARQEDQDLLAAIDDSLQHLEADGRLAGMIHDWMKP